jgi:membrane protease subunit HflC
MTRAFIIIMFGAIVLWLQTAIFTVDETEQAVVLQFGEPVRAERDAGMKFKLPWPFQNVTFFSKKLLEYDAEPTEVISMDKKTLIVDNFARWRIINPIQFLKSLTSEVNAFPRLDDIIYSELREELGQHEFSEIIARNREKIMTIVTDSSNTKLAEFGLEVIDVRIKRVDLPKENEQAVYGRMRAERNRQANLYRSEGEEEATKIMANTDKDKELILANAYMVAQEIRGKGDAEAIAIYAEAFNQDPDFYNFSRKLEAYKKTLKEGTTVVLSPDNEFLDVLQDGK